MVEPASRSVVEPVEPLGEAASRPREPGSSRSDVTRVSTPARWRSPGSTNDEVPFAARADPCWWSSRSSPWARPRRDRVSREAAMGTSRGSRRRLAGARRARPPNETELDHRMKAGLDHRMKAGLDQRASAERETVENRLPLEQVFDYTRCMATDVIDPHQVDDDAPTPTDLITRVRARRAAAEAAELDVLLLAIEWAHAHPALPGDQSWKAPRATYVPGPGGGLDDGAPTSGDLEVVEWFGIPPITWSAAAPFAAANHMTTSAGRAYLRDALVLRHRMPRLHAKVCCREGPRVAGPPDRAEGPRHPPRRHRARRPGHRTHRRNRRPRHRRQAHRGRPSSSSTPTSSRSNHSKPSSDATSPSTNAPCPTPGSPTSPSAQTGPTSSTSTPPSPGSPTPSNATGHWSPTTYAAHKPSGSSPTPPEPWPSSTTPSHRPVEEHRGLPPPDPGHHRRPRAPRPRRARPHPPRHHRAGVARPHRSPRHHPPRHQPQRPLPRRQSAGHEATDPYVPTFTTAEKVRLRNPVCVFPHCTKRSRSCDLDHLDRPREVRHHLRVQPRTTLPTSPPAQDPRRLAIPTTHTRHLPLARTPRPDPPHHPHRHHRPHRPLGLIGRTGRLPRIRQEGGAS